MKYKPFDYQRKAADFMYSTPFCAYWGECGVGKTVTTATVLARLLSEQEITRPLIIAPKSVAVNVWPAEFEKWDHLRAYKISVAVGSEKQRVAALDTRADVYVINRECIPWLVQRYGNFWPFDCIVIDEASGFKNVKSQRWKALYKIRRYVDRIIELTGTPAPNSAEDLYAQIKLLDRGHRLGSTLTKFRNSYFRAINKPWAREYHPTPTTLPRITRAVSDVAMSMKTEDYRQLPPLVNRELRLNLSAAQRAKYDKLADKYVSDFSGLAVNAANAAVLSSKLLQLSNGAVYDDSGEYAVVHDEKLNALTDLVDSLNGEPALIAYQYRHDLDRLRAVFPNALEASRPGDIEKWNTKTVPGAVMLAHPANAGYGLNLQDGGRHAIWFSLTWNLEHYQQFNARLHRTGQDKPVFIHHLLVRDTIEERVVAALINKDKTQSNIVAAVKAEVGERRHVA